MIKLIIIVGAIILFVLYPWFRCAVLNPHLTTGYGIIDLFKYLKYKCWRNATCGALIAYTGLFGKGKTLSCVHTVVSLYNRYNDKIVWDKFRSKFVRQKVVVLSNVELKIPFKKFESLRQLVELSHQLKELDEKYDTITFIYVLADELSVQLNSRNFKSNIDAPFLNTLLTCRHYHISMFYTAQRFNQVDALLRQVTQTVIECNKLWRFQQVSYYDAFELENCTNLLLVKPLKRSCWFVRNRDYEAYDTLACVEDLKKSELSGDMISEKEILELQTAQPIDSVVHYSRKAKRRRPFKSK